MSTETELELGIESLGRIVSKLEFSCNVQKAIVENGVNRTISFESDNAIGTRMVLEAHYSNLTKSEKISVALEMHKTLVVGLIAAGIAAVIAIFIKILDWCGIGSGCGGGGGGGGGGSSAPSVPPQSSPEAIKVMMKNTRTFRELETTINNTKKEVENFENFIKSEMLKDYGSHFKDWMFVFIDNEPAMQKVSKAFIEKTMKIIPEVEKEEDKINDVFRALDKANEQLVAMGHAAVEQIIKEPGIICNEYTYDPEGKLVFISTESGFISFDLVRNRIRLTKESVESEVEN